MGEGSGEQERRVKKAKLDIADKELEAIAKKIGSQAMETFARGSLGIDADEIEDMKIRRRGDTAGFKFDILKHWKNQNQGPNAREDLDTLLKQEAKEYGLFDYRKVKKSWNKAKRKFLE